MNGTRLVLRRKKPDRDGQKKIASRRDQGRLAILLEAQRLTEIRLGGGIVSPLLPTAGQSKAKVAAIGKTYEVARVKVRGAQRLKKSDRQAARTALANDALMVRLAEAYRATISKNPGAHTMSVKAFIHWLRQQLRQRDSVAYIAVRQRAPDLLNVEFGDRWFADAFAQRRKTQS